MWVGSSAPASRCLNHPPVSRVVPTRNSQCLPVMLLLFPKQKLCVCAFSFGPSAPRQHQWCVCSTRASLAVVLFCVHLSACPLPCLPRHFSPHTPTCSKPYCCVPLSTRSQVAYVGTRTVPVTPAMVEIFTPASSQPERKHDQLNWGWLPSQTTSHICTFTADDPCLTNLAGRCQIFHRKS